jgi:hypothetical protein
VAKLIIAVFFIFANVIKILGRITFIYDCLVLESDINRVKSDVLLSIGTLMLEKQKLSLSPEKLTYAYF